MTLQAVAFSAYASARQTYSDNDVVVFDNVITNVGGGYSTDTNRFTCPVEGLYLLSLTLTQAHDMTNVIQAAIMLEEENVGEVFSVADDDDEDKEGDQSSITTVVHCNA